MAKKVLVVDDEKLIVKGIVFSLTQEGMEVDTAFDGEEAIGMIKGKQYDVILLDIMLPKLTGLEVCQQVREFSNVPIIMLTAKGEDMDKIMGLEYGADDYMTKPFNILELKARIKALLRRSQRTAPAASVPAVLELRNMRINQEARKVVVNDKEINLTAKEYDLLVLLVTHPNKVYDRDSLLELIWGKHYMGDARTVDVHVRRLREKVEPNPSVPEYIYTKWGVGYYIKG
ncbi:MAG: response regulator transcription factor [Lachnospiraceae bacterium]|nr:response regulator transcription factor [Lachnospiraceae bacterium]MDY5741487.1 response regulator transcription factor [Lachnospiraceae bacterium]